MRIMYAIVMFEHTLYRRRPKAAETSRRKRVLLAHTYCSNISIKIKTLRSTLQTTKGPAQYKVVNVHCSTTYIHIDVHFSGSIKPTFASTLQNASCLDGNIFSIGLKYCICCAFRNYSFNEVSLLDLLRW